jgi:hypothetical protein
VSATALVWWVSLFAVIVVLALAVMQLLRALRDGKRIAGRIEALADHPMFAALEKAEADIGRLERAGAQFVQLAERAVLAVTTIRKGPLPPEVVAGYRLLRGQVTTIRGVARR